MTRTAKIVRYVAFSLMAAFGLLGSLFVAGYAFEDLDTWTATWRTALWAVPMVVMSVLALRRPAAAGPVLVAVTGVVAVLTLLDSLAHLVPRDDWGPVGSVTVLALAVALGFLGLRRTTLAGLLLVVLGLAQGVATFLSYGPREGGEGPGPGAMLTGSSGVVVVPVLVVGLLFLLAGALGHEPLRHGGTPRVRPAH